MNTRRLEEQEVLMPSFMKQTADLDKIFSEFRFSILITEA
jgi:hypothetical protein